MAGTDGKRWEKVGDEWVLVPEGQCVAVAEATRTCITCKEAKPIDAYYRHVRGPGGRQSKCMACHRAYQVEYRQISKQEADGIRTCTACRKEKPLNEYRIDCHGRGGRAARCGDCCRNSYASIRAAKRAEAVTGKQGGWQFSTDELLHQAAAAFRRWSECEDLEERDGAREAAIYRARQLLAAVGG